MRAVRLASTEAGSGVVTTHESNTGARGSKTEEHQLFHPPGFHGLRWTLVLTVDIVEIRSSQIISVSTSQSWWVSFNARGMGARGGENFVGLDFFISLT